MNYKKKLRLKRKRIKKNKFQPRIIVDTNIWYDFTDNPELFGKIKKEITPTYISLSELCNTGNLNGKPIEVRNAIRRIMDCQQRMIFEPPMPYLIKRGNKRKYKFITLNEIITLLETSKKIANNSVIKDSEKEAFYEYIKSYKQPLTDLANSINEEAKKIKERINDLDEHRNKNSLIFTYLFVNDLALRGTDGKFNIKRVPHKELELLICVLDAHFKKIELGERKWQRNDLFDIFILSYVRRGDKYWTNDKYWNDLIEEIGLGHYLYKAN